MNSENIQKAQDPVGQEDSVFVPGMVGSKIATVILGLAITAVGVVWLWHPVTLYLFGGDATAEVVYVEMQKEGQEPVRLSNRKDLADAEDPTRNAAFIYFVRFRIQEGEGGDLGEETQVTARREIITRLNYGQVLRPMLEIGDEVWVAYDKGDPTDLVDVGDVTTWAFGIFFFCIGLLITISQGIILYYSRTPVYLDSIGSEMTEVAEGEESLEEVQRQKEEEEEEQSTSR